MRQLSDENIRKGLSEIDTEEYYETLLSQTEKHWERIKEADLFKKKFKVVHYLMTKGFEQDLVKEAIDSLNRSTDD